MSSYVSLSLFKEPLSNPKLDSSTVSNVLLHSINKDKITEQAFLNKRLKSANRAKVYKQNFSVTWKGNMNGRSSPFVPFNGSLDEIKKLKSIADETS